jgi:hypothetical protein
MGVRERWRSARIGAVVIRSNPMARAWRPGGRTVSASSSMLCVAHLGATVVTEIGFRFLYFGCFTRTATGKALY